MPSLMFTDANVLDVGCPSSKKAELYRDESIKGLVLQVTRLGTRAYLAEYRMSSGSKPQVRLGTPATKADKADPDKLTLQAARTAAVKAVDALRLTDAKENKSKGTDHLCDVFANYVRARNIIPENSRRYEAVLRGYGAPFWNKPVEGITAGAVLDQRAKINDGTFARWQTTKGPSKALGGPGCANDFIEYGSMVYTWHRPKNPNPFSGIEAYETGPARDKYNFEPTDMPRLYQAVKRLTAERRILFWTLMLTGGRPLAVLRMKWARLDLDAGTYKLTNNKVECAGWKPATSPEWDYPLDSWLIELLREHRMFTRDDAVYVFQSTQLKRANKALSHTSLDTIFAELRQKLALPTVCTPYAARYTRGTYSEILFGDTLLTQRMLNHQSDYGKAGTKVAGAVMGATGGYVKTLTEVVRSKVQTYADTVQELCGLRPMSPQTTQIFIENKSLTIYDRHALLLQAGTPEVLKDAKGTLPA